MPKPHPSRRWFFLIYPQFQLRLMAFVISILLVSNLIFLAQIYRTHNFFVNVGRELGLPAVHPYFTFLQSQQHEMLLQLGVASVVSVVVSLLVLFYLSHRIAGPVVKLKGHLQKVIASDDGVEDLQFRKDDFFSDLPALVNESLKDRTRYKKTGS